MKLQKAFILIPLVCLASFTFVILAVAAQSGGLNLEAEQNWDTYGVGGTCVYGTQNIFVGDLDGDGTSEIMTGGFAYHITQNDTRTASEAPLKVWSWNGQNVTLKASTSWNGTIYCLYAADVDQDGKVDLLCGGSFRNETGHSTSSMRVLNLRDGLLELKAHYEGIRVNSIFVSDVDRDGINDLLTVGRSVSNSSQLSIWHLEGNKLALVNSLPLEEANITSANTVYASDLENDGTVEIMVGGYADSLSNSKGLVSLWRWNGQELKLETVKTWQLAEGSATTIAGGVQGNTVVYNVKAADLDKDGKKEMVTAGSTYDGVNVNGEIKVWRWDGSDLIELASQEWATDYMTEAKSIALNDVNGDGKVEIIESGIAAAEGSFNNPEGIHDRGELRVFSYNGTSLVLEESNVWTFDEGECAWNVGTGDVDNDGMAEIITVGCSALKGQCDPDMRIWSLPVKQQASPDYLPYAVAGLLVFAGTSFIVYMYLRRK